MATTAVDSNYARAGLAAHILDRLAAAGKSPDALTPDDLAPVDEFHVGGRAATAAFAQKLGPLEGPHLLDIGSGLGGPSRYLALHHGCRVTGIDLTSDYVEAAGMLAARVGLQDRVSYRQASALALPFTDQSFDGAVMMHVGMNIADKPALFREARRVLKPGSVFGIYDVMRQAPGDFAFPVPWAMTAEASFVDAPDTYRSALASAGFAISQVADRRDFALATFAQVRRRSAEETQPALGLHVVLGPSAPARFANLAAAITAGVLAPCEIIATAA